MGRNGVVRLHDRPPSRPARWQPRGNDRGGFHPRQPFLPCLCNRCDAGKPWCLSHPGSIVLQSRRRTERYQIKMAGPIPWLVADPVVPAQVQLLAVGRNRTWCRDADKPLRLGPPTVFLHTIRNLLARPYADSVPPEAELRLPNAPQPHRHHLLVGRPANRLVWLSDHHLPSAQPHTCRLCRPLPPPASLVAADGEKLVDPHGCPPRSSRALAPFAVGHLVPVAQASELFSL